MSEERLTTEGLPIPMEGIAEVILRDESMGAEISNPLEFLRLIGSQNHGYIRECFTILEDARAGGIESGELAMMTLGFAYGYEILRRQGESYKLEDQLSD